ncbi:MAG: hypothetical protein LBP25_01955 [Tannerellaceae bacterium]|jgi:hypothetical protein|nr:hypothetical protein [Tannerellaceae bacterium]
MKKQAYKKMRIVEALSFLCIAANVVVALCVYSDNPDVISPTIWNIIMYVGLTLLLLIPHLYNYPVPVTEENKEQLYACGVELAKLLKLITTSSFFSMVLPIVSNPFVGIGIAFSTCFAILFLLIYMYKKMKAIARETGSS